MSRNGRNIETEPPEAPSSPSIVDTLDIALQQLGLKLSPARRRPIAQALALALLRAGWIPHHQFRERAPYTVRCDELGLEPVVFREYEAAYRYALRLLDRESVQSEITDRFGKTVAHT